MNRAKGGGWEFNDYAVPGQKGGTINPAAGCNNMNCAPRQRGVCYAQRISSRLGRFCPLCPSFKPHLHDGTQGTPNRLMEALELRKPMTLTPVSMGDLFGLRFYMTDIILKVVKNAYWHTFLTLTKLPQNAHRFNPFPENVWFGVTVNEEADVWRLDHQKKIKCAKRWAIFEPLYSAIDYDLTFLDWVIIGPQSRPMFQPKKEWVQSILDNARGVPVFMKSTLEWQPKRRESPK